LFATKEIRTTWGSLIYKDHVPDGGRPRGLTSQGGRGHRGGQDEHPRVRGWRGHGQRSVRHLALVRFQKSGRRIKPRWVSWATLRCSCNLQCSLAKEGSYASQLA